METVKLLLAISVSVNVSLAMYFFPPMTLVWVLRKQKRGRMAVEFLRFNEKRPNVIRKLLRDFVFSTALFIFGIYLLAHKRIRESPFVYFVDNKLQTAMAVQIGNQLFRLVHPLVPNQDIKRSFLCSCYEIVTIFSLLIILIIKENNIFAVLTFLFEGGVIFGDISRAENQWNSDTCARRRTQHVATLLGNLFATLSMRVVCPVVLLVYAIHKYSLLQMSYISLALFILNTVFYCTLVFFELFSIYESLRTTRTSLRRESDVETETAQPHRTTVNNNVYSSFARAPTSLIAMNNLESHRVVAGRVSGIPQSLHASSDASTTLDHHGNHEIVIKNF